MLSVNIFIKNSLPRKICCYVMSYECYVMLYCVMLCYIMLCYIMFTAVLLIIFFINLFPHKHKYREYCLNCLLTVRARSSK